MRRTFFPIAFFLLLALLTSCSLIDRGGDSNLETNAISASTHEGFPIDEASIHAETTCNDCHGPFDTFSEFSCTDCHEHEADPTTAAHSGISGFVYDSIACFRCHPDGTSALGGIDHETFFPISAGTNHDSVECSSCHLDSSDRSVLGCATDACHAKATTDSDHTAVSGYTYESTSCYGCHPKGTADAASSVNHALIFPINAGSVHAAASCTNCHVNATNRAIVQCIDCHMANGTTQHSQTASSSQHTRVGGYLWNTADCLDCHPNSDTKTVATHLPFLIGTSPQNKHYRRECRRCHTDSLANKPFEATDFNTYSCIDCHNTDHTRNYNNTATTCTQRGCHPDGRKGG